MKTSEKKHKVLILFRQGTASAKSVSQEAAKWLLDRGGEVFSHPDQTIAKSIKKASKQTLGSLNLVVVLGGDGTYLEAVRYLEGRKIPILGVNMGSLGFLTETRLEDLYQTLELALTGKMEMRPRAMIQVKVKRKGKVRIEHTALNDVVIERGGNHMITLSAFCEKQHVCDYKADGLIIAAPTGSTAYNLAAGGPILHPEVKSFVVTPICPHSLTNRPILFPENKTLIFKVKKGLSEAALTVDGQQVTKVTGDDEISIKLDPNEHFVLRRPSHNYFDLLREKLNFGTRAVF